MAMSRTPAGATYPPQQQEQQQFLHLPKAKQQHRSDHHSPRMSSLATDQFRDLFPVQLPQDAPMSNIVSYLFIFILVFF